MKWSWQFITYALGWLGYLGYFWSHAFFFNSSGGISIRLSYLLGDWAAHFTMATAMVERGIWLSESPLLQGAAFTYPFLTNLISALLIKLDVPFLLAFILPSFVLSWLCVLLLFQLYKQLSGSAWIALVASMIFMLNGGTGFTYFISDIIQSPEPIATIIEPPRYYTNIVPEGIIWITVFNSMIAPQRAFALGFPLTLAIIWLLTPLNLGSVQQNTTKNKTQKSKKMAPRLILAGFIAGALPLAHTHSFLSLGILCAWWSLVSITRAPTLRSKIQAILRWGGFALITLGVSMPTILKLLSPAMGSSFITWLPGWYAGNQLSDTSILEFWFQNWTIVPVLAMIGWLLWRKRQHRATKDLHTRVHWSYFGGFALLFLLLNLIKFQPFIWDNTKILVWASVGMSFLAGFALVQAWKSTAISKVAVVLITVFICFSGAVDLYRDISPNRDQFQMYSESELALATWVKTHTSTAGTWLAGTYHNHWLFNLTGRQVLMTFPGWLWTHGYDYRETEEALKAMMRYPEKNLSNFEKYNVRYVVIGPFERDEYQARMANFQKTRAFRIVHQNNSTVILERTNWQPELAP